MTKIKQFLWLTFAAGVSCILMFLTSLPTVTQAAAPALPTRSAPQPAPPSSVPAGAGWILLHIQPDQPWASGDLSWQNLWTVVQWQGSDQVWNTVAAWQAPPDGVSGSEATKQYAVLPGDLGKGPFRWIVCAAQGGAELATSDWFHLPSTAGDTVHVAVDIGAAASPLLPVSGQEPHQWLWLLLGGGLALLGIALAIGGWQRIERTDQES